MSLPVSPSGDPAPSFRPVMQSNGSAPGGDCFRAYVASILGLPLESVPRFLEDSTGGLWRQEAWDAVRSWADLRGAYPFHVDPETGSRSCLGSLGENVYYIAAGPSPNHPEFGHCVNGLGGQLVYDPFDGGTDGRKMLAGDPWLLIAFAENPQYGPEHAPDGAGASNQC